MVRACAQKERKTNKLYKKLKLDMRAKRMHSGKKEVQENKLI
jgi:hypothetical protein